MNLDSISAAGAGRHAESQVGVSHGGCRASEPSHVTTRLNLLANRIYQQLL